MKKKFGVYGYVVSFLAVLVLFALPCERAEAKYQYSTRTKSITKAGEYQIQQKEDERIVFLFKPEQSGVYIARATSQQAGLDSACLGFRRDAKDGMGEGISWGGSSDSDGASVAYHMYCEKGKVCSIAIGMGKYIGGAGDAIKSLACEYKLEIIRINCRVQKLSMKKACTLSKRDYITYEGAPEPGDAFMTFQAKKTGYYRFHGKNTMCTSLKVMERGKDGSIYSISTGYGPENMVKMKKGKSYILRILPSSRKTIMVQYAAKKRTVELHYNYPWKNGDETCEYDVQKGSKLGVLLPPEPTESRFTDTPGKMQKKRKFLGWYTKKKGGKKITAKTKNCQKIKKLYAHWK